MIITTIQQIIKQQIEHQLPPNHYTDETLYLECSETRPYNKEYFNILRNKTILYEIILTDNTITIKDIQIRHINVTTTTIEYCNPQLFQLIQKALNPCFINPALIHSIIENYSNSSNASDEITTIQLPQTHTSKQQQTPNPKTTPP